MLVQPEEDETGREVLKTDGRREGGTGSWVMQGSSGRPERGLNDSERQDSDN